MIYDKQNMFAWGTALKADGTSTGVVFGDVIDLWGGNTIPPAATGANAAPYAVNGKVGGSQPHDPGRGCCVQIYINIHTALDSGGSAVFTLQLVNSANADLSSGTVLATVIPATTIQADASDFPAGKIIQTAAYLPVGATSRYLGLWQIIATAQLTAGKISAGLVWDRQTFAV